MGNAFRKVLKDSWNYKLPKNTAYPICVGKASNYFKIPLKFTLNFYLQSFISNIVNVCVKHIPIGQKIGQDCIVSSLKLINNFVNKSNDFTLDDLGEFALIVICIVLSMKDCQLGFIKHE